jgi:hypothetical protein
MGGNARGGEFHKYKVYTRNVITPSAQNPDFLPRKGMSAGMVTRLFLILGEESR